MGLRPPNWLETWKFCCSKDKVGGCCGGICGGSCGGICTILLWSYGMLTPLPDAMGTASPVMKSRGS